MADQTEGGPSGAPIPQPESELAEADANFDEGIRCIKVGHRE